MDMPIKPITKTGRRPILDIVRMCSLDATNATDARLWQGIVDLLVGHNSPRQCDQDAHAGIEGLEDSKEVGELGLNFGGLAHAFIDGLIFAMDMVVILAAQDIFKYPGQGHVVETTLCRYDEDEDA